MRRLRREQLVEVDRPFAVFVDPCLDIEGDWNVHIVGYGLDQMTVGRSPHEALRMAAEVIAMLTGRCEGSPDGEHDWSVDTALDGFDGEGDLVPRGGSPAWGCSRCDERASKDIFEDVT